MAVSWTWRFPCFSCVDFAFHIISNEHPEHISSFWQGDGKGEEKDNKTNHKTESTLDRNGSENDALMNLN